MCEVDNAEPIEINNMSRRQDTNEERKNLMNQIRQRLFEYGAVDSRVLYTSVNWANGYSSRSVTNQSCSYMQFRGTRTKEPPSFSSVAGQYESNCRRVTNCLSQRRRHLYNKCICLGLFVARDNISVAGWSIYSNKMAQMGNISSIS